MLVFYISAKGRVFYYKKYILYLDCFIAFSVKYLGFFSHSFGHNLPLFTFSGKLMIFMEKSVDVGIAFFFRKKSQVTKDFKK